MNSTRIIVCGARGRMGQLLVQCAKEDPELELVGTIDSGDDLNAIVDNADVVIDFTTHEATLPSAEIATSHGKALVIGTTGHNDEEQTHIRETVRGIPVVWSSNFSTGVNVLFHLTRRAGELLRGSTVEIAETHHTKKKDAPSGTAKSLARILEKIGMTNIPIHSERTGDVVGDHTVRFSTPDETLELTHRALDRATFARGALRAAKWVITQEPGIYDMQDVLGLKK